MDEKKIESELRGNTLRVYWYLLEHGGESGVGVREVQRALGFSSPTLAAYHLDKLVNLGLVDKRRGEYYLVKTVKVGVLKYFMRFGSFLLPRYVLYAMLFTALLVFGMLRFDKVSFWSVLALIFGILGTAIFWYETLRVWRESRKL
jgi:hypothetical protein